MSRTSHTCSGLRSRQRVLSSRDRSKEHSRAPDHRCCAHKIVVLPGDGIGPEIASVAQNVLQIAGETLGEEFQFEEHLIGGAAM